MQVLDQMDRVEEEERKKRREKNANKGGTKAGAKKQRKKGAAKQTKVESDTEGICHSPLQTSFSCCVPVRCVGSV